MEDLLSKTNSTWFHGSLEMASECTNGGWNWHDEIRSHMAAFARKTTIEKMALRQIGVNPDFRHSRIGFCVSWPV